MELVKIGRIGKTHGVKGELKISVEDRYYDDAFMVESFILKLGGQPLPHFIKYLRGDRTLLLKLEGVDDKETASALQFIDIFLPKASVSEANAKFEDQIVFLSWVGYTVLDETMGNIGEIDFVYELPEHYLAELIIEHKTVIIPLHFDLIKEVDDKEKTVLMSLPEGILDVNS